MKLPPLIVSVQASSGTLRKPEVLLDLARASVESGASMLRLEGIEAITLIAHELNLPVIGLIKRVYADSEVYITPTAKEVKELLATTCAVIALDGTGRQRPACEKLSELIRQVHEGGRLAMADCDSIESARFALAAGADILSTTLSGYTHGGPVPSEPDLALVRAIRELTTRPVIAEGRYSSPEQVQAARLCGADSVVVGGAINDPVKQTRAFLAGATIQCDTPVLAVDIGGTWLRWAVWDGDLGPVTAIPTPPTGQGRLDAIRKAAHENALHRIGISTGGTVHPCLGVVTEAKSEIIPDHQGLNFPCGLSEFGVVALNDGLATAWAHACHPRFAGTRVATLALGTGVGFGLVDRGRILMGSGGEYPRLNDLRSPSGEAYEELLGGAHQTGTPAKELSPIAQELIATIRRLYMPEHLVLCGGIGLSEGLEVDAVRSPFGSEAGLVGAARLCTTPPVLFPRTRLQ